MPIQDSAMPEAFNRHCKLQLMSKKDIGKYKKSLQ
jgi:hypothetical protein